MIFRLKEPLFLHGKMINFRLKSPKEITFPEQIMIPSREKSVFRLAFFDAKFFRFKTKLQYDPNDL